MNTSNVAGRYAAAFFSVAAEEKKYEEYYQELKHFTDIIDVNSNLREFLANPVFDRNDKEEVVEKILGQIDLSPLTANFVRLLVMKGRIAGIAGIEKHYRQLMDEAIGLARATVKTAFPLTPELAEQLKQSLESMTGRNVEMMVEEDPSLLGGVVVRVGDKLYDGSIKIQLEKMMKLLGEEN